jgi:hypothetical protein
MTPMIEQQVKSVGNINLTPRQKLSFQQEYDKQLRNPSAALILTV